MLQLSTWWRDGMIRETDQVGCLQECFLIPYDMQRQYNLHGIYMNPRVVSTYVLLVLITQDLRSRSYIADT